MKIGRVIRTVILLLIASGHIFTASAGQGEPQHSHGHDAESTHENHDEQHADSEEEGINVTETIMHHIKDAHDWHILDWDGHPVSLPLPIILWTEDGLVTGMSSAFHHDDHGHHVAEIGGQKFVKNHGHIYYASANANDHGQHLEIGQNDKGEDVVLNDAPLDLSITKNAASLIFSVFVILILFLGAAKAYRSNGVPKGLASFIEPLVVFMRDEVARPNIGEKRYAAFVPYLCTLFFFIWINNMLGLIPFIPGGANTTGNIAVTLVLAAFTLILVLVNSNGAYWKHIFWMPGVPVPVRLLLAPIELIGVFTKPFALMIRLFANMTAGHIVILSLISLIFIFETEFMAIASVPLTLFIFVIKVLVALLQAYIFALLTALFIGQAVAEDDHH